jgi:peptidoglycan hydrolase CwlO-like protein
MIILMRLIKCYINISHTQTAPDLKLSGLFAPLQQQMPTSVINSDPISKIFEKLERIDTKLDQLDSIQLAVHDITVRLDDMDSKICHIEKSQTFLSDQYETISSCTNVNKKNIIQIQNDIERLKNENMSLHKANENYSEAIIDLKCRSMRDNLMFFGISEVNTLPRFGPIST